MFAPRFIFKEGDCLMKTKYMHTSAWKEVTLASFPLYNLIYFDCLCLIKHIKRQILGWHIQNMKLHKKRFFCSTCFISSAAMSTIISFQRRRTGQDARWHENAAALSLAGLLVDRVQEYRISFQCLINPQFAGCIAVLDTHRKSEDQRVG